MTLARIFEPRSIVVVGASTDPGKRGHQANSPGGIAMSSVQLR